MVLCTCLVGGGEVSRKKIKGLTQEDYRNWKNNILLSAVYISTGTVSIAINVFAIFSHRHTQVSTPRLLCRSQHELIPKIHPWGTSQSAHCLSQTKTASHKITTSALQRLFRISLKLHDRVFRVWLSALAIILSLTEYVNMLVL